MLPGPCNTPLLLSRKIVIELQVDIDCNLTPYHPPLLMTILTANPQKTAHPESSEAPEFPINKKSCQNQSPSPRPRSMSMFRMAM
jgi:hypothetical protein